MDVCVRFDAFSAKCTHHGIFHTILFDVLSMYQPSVDAAENTVSVHFLANQRSEFMNPIGVLYYGKFASVTYPPALQPYVLPRFTASAAYALKTFAAV